tara:strand:- start:190354 stop:191652 length:1299 start_codon:yes stop_codon:yes gene_type:complete
MSESNLPDDSEPMVQRIDEAHPEHAPTSPPATPSVTLPKRDEPPLGMRRAADDGTELIDAMAGRASLFGFGFQPHLDAIMAATEQYLGDAASVSAVDHRIDENLTDNAQSDDVLFTALMSTFGSSDALNLTSACLTPSADLAIEKAVELARTSEPSSRYRTIALVGSDHGRTGVCRTASGRPELHENYGPMMAGFCHVVAEDIDSMRQNIDDQTAAVLVSPIDLHDAARPLSAKYLAAVRELCDEYDLYLIIDESRLCVGSASTPFVFSSISDIAADAVIVAAGLFAGLPAGILMTGDRMVANAITDTSQYPMLRDVAVETLSAVNRQGTFAATGKIMSDFAVQVAECIGHYEFVRDIHATGMTLGIQTDVQSSELVRAAARHGLRIEPAGDTSIRLQPPLVMTDTDQDDLLKRLGATMDVVRRDFADLVVS